MTKYLVVTPKYVARRDSMPAALKLARAVDSNAADTYGPGAGADCFVVAELGDRLEYRGMACGRSLIGKTFGCADAIIERARKAIDDGKVRGA